MATGEHLVWRKVLEPDELGDARAAALHHDGPNLVEIISDVELV